MSTTNGLLSAIEGFSAEHAGSAEHEANVKLLQRVASELKRGKASDTASSPGAREAHAAAQTNMAAEEGHSGGEGNKTTNAPGSARRGEPVANPQENSRGTVNTTRTGPDRSAGNVRSVLAGPAARSGVVDIRRGAAIKALEAERSSAGNAHSNAPGHAAGNEARIGDVRPPASAPADRNTNASSFEGAPNEIGKDVTGDGFARARQLAKKLAPAAR